MLEARGVLLVDKAAGDTSTDIVRQVKKAFNCKKVGHTGTLDPFATGLLPICLGEALKYSRWLYDARKTYEFTIKLGIKTDTADNTGKQIEQQFVPSKLALDATAKCFIGEIEQIPPKFSALKVKGKRAYELARQGEAFELTGRRVHIYTLRLTQLDANTISGCATVSKGTYIRTLCEDIAKSLGTVGYCEQLRRTTVTPYSLNDNTLVITSNTLKDYFDKTDKSWLHSFLYPIDSLCQQFPNITLKLADIDSLRQGRKINLNENYTFNENICRIYTKNNTFVGLGEHESHQIKPFRLMRY